MKKLLLFVCILVLLIIVMTGVAYAYDGVGNTEGVDFFSYILEEAYILIPALYFLGWCIKRIPKIPNWIIPFTLIVIAIPAAMAIVGWDIQGAIQGVVVAGLTVFTNQLWKQGNEAFDE